MSVQLTDFRVENKNSLVGRFDVKMEKNGKFKEYCNLTYWDKNGNKWVKFPCFQLNGEWKEIINMDEDSKKQFFAECLEAIKLRLEQDEKISMNNEFGFDL